METDKRILSFIEKVKDKKPHELVKVNLFYHPYKTEHVPYILCTGIRAYGFSSLLLENSYDIVKVKDILDNSYIKNVEIFNPLDTKNYKYIKE